MVFVTGSTGFVGKHLVPELKNPICIPHEDILFTDWKQATKVYFLSAYGNMASHTDEQAIIKANLIDLTFVLASVDWSKIESFVFISTSSVKRRVQTMYSRTKRAAEELLLAYMEKYNAPITIIRPLSITGVGEQREHLIPTLIDSCLNGTEMDFVPEPTHDFIDIDDIVNGILILSENKARGIFELGTGIERTNDQIRTMVEKKCGKKANIHLVKSMRAYDDEKWVSENFKARGFGWLPHKDIELSISEMVDEAKKH